MAIETREDLGKYLQGQGQDWKRKLRKHVLI